MRNRVALAATLTVLLVLVLLVIFSGLAVVDEHNDRLSSDVELALQLVSGTVPTGTDAEDFSVLTQYMKNKGLRLDVYTKSGEAVYASEGAVAPLDEFDFAQARLGSVGVYKTTGANGKSILCAIDHLSDSSIVRVSIPREGFWQSVGASRSAVYVCLFLIIALSFFVVLILLNERRTRAIERIMDVLDSYSDGRFDVRLTKNDGFSNEAAAAYNAILSRIDERIFNQRSRNQALSVVMNQMQNGIIAVDDKLRVILVTPVAKRLLGITGSAQGLHINDASQDVRLDQVLSEAMAQIGVYTNEVAARTAVGRGHRPLRLYVSPMRKDGKVVGALAMVEDITELRRLEQLRTDFAANVSHELKTPLTSIRGFVETLLDGAIEKPEMAKKFLNIIMLETERLTRLINDILSISKLESGMDEGPKERIRFDKAAFDVTEMLAIHAKEKQVQLSCHMNADPVYVIGNKDHVEQMLINLIENGIKYNKPGGSVTVQVFKSDTEANLTVADTGIGIPEEHLPRMFERFYRVDKGRSRSMGGTGLGLAIVKHIVRAMHGEIEVHSKFGEGTEFLVTLPLAPQSAGSDSGDDPMEEE